MSDEERTDLEVEMHEDGSATIHLPTGENLDRCSACIRCMLRHDLEDEDIDYTIGDEAYCTIHDGIAQVVIHERCVKETDIILERRPAR